MKLIKINPDHYIIVDDSEIDYDNEPYLLIKDDYETYIHKHKGDNKPTTEHYKITHSNIGHLYQDSILSLSLQEVKELIGEVDIWQKFKEIDGSCQKGGYEHWLFESGYNQALEDNKEKKYTEAQLIWAIQEAYGHGQNDEFDGVNKSEKSIIFITNYLQPKTEWEVEFIDNKLTLKQ